MSRSPSFAKSLNLALLGTLSITTLASSALAADAPVDLRREVEFNAPIPDKEGIRRIAFRPRYFLTSASNYGGNVTYSTSYERRSTPERVACVNKQIREFNVALKDPAVRNFVFEAHMDGLEVDVLDNAGTGDDVEKRVAAADTALKTKMAFYVPQPNDPPIKFTASITSSGVCHVYPASDIIFQVQQKKRRFNGYVLDAQTIENSEMLTALQDVLSTLNGASDKAADRRISSSSEAKPETVIPASPAGGSGGKAKSGKAG